jgi:hypothetical protein
MSPGGAATEKSHSDALLLYGHELKPGMIYGLIMGIVHWLRTVHVDI